MRFLLLLMWPRPLLSERVVLTGRATPTMLKAGKIVEEFGASVTTAPLAEISSKHSRDPLADDPR